MALTAKVKKTINTGLQIIIASLSLWFIYKQIDDPQVYLSFVITFNKSYSGESFITLLVISLLLMPVNWMLEALKWKRLIHYTENFTALQSFKSVLSGITFSLFTPNRTGDFIGRLLTLPHSNRVTGTLLTLTGSIAQLITTLFIGLIALCFFLPRYFDLSQPVVTTGYVFVVIISLAACFLMVFLFLKIKLISKINFSSERPFWKKLQKNLQIMAQVDRKTLLITLGLSFSRYFIFSTQFYLLLIAFGFSIPWFEAFILIAMTYFTMAAIPTIALVDLGIRGSVSMFFLGLYQTVPGASVSILAASTSIWIINLAIPAIAGLLFIYRVKLIRKV
jgi:uncharacterized membrane protein YbhN (UPF0104 family)